jgi:hypothetical protein
MHASGIWIKKKVFLDRISFDSSLSDKSKSYRSIREQHTCSAMVWTNTKSAELVSVCKSYIFAYTKGDYQRKV